MLFTKKFNMTLTVSFIFLLGQDFTGLVPYIIFLYNNNNKRHMVVCRVA